MDMQRCAADFPNLHHANTANQTVMRMNKFPVAYS
jgi:hypothetical protein